LAAHPADRAAAGLGDGDPPLVNNFIGAFKNTALVLIIGLFDLLNTAQHRADRRQLAGLRRRGYIFTAAIYFCFCFFMSRYSQCSSAPSTGAIAASGRGGIDEQRGGKNTGSAASTASIIEMQAVHKWYGEFMC